MAKPLRDRSGRDDRPRIHIWPTSGTTVAWSMGPHGRPRYSGSAGTAFDEALGAIGHKPAVIFWETRDVD